MLTLNLTAALMPGVLLGTLAGTVLLGFIALAIGFVRWINAVRAEAEAVDELRVIGK